MKTKCSFCGYETEIDTNTNLCDVCVKTVDNWPLPAATDLPLDSGVKRAHINTQRLIAWGINRVLDEVRRLTAPPMVVEMLGGTLTDESRAELQKILELWRDPHDYHSPTLITPPKAEEDEDKEPTQ